MDALLMCGGRGTRLDADIEKPLFTVGGRRMVDRVRAALVESRVESTFVVTSPHVPATRAHLDGLTVIETAGEGYVADLESAVADDRVCRPVLTVAADLPLLAPEHLNTVLDRHAGGSLTVCVPTALKRLLGLTVETPIDGDQPALSPVGLNVVGEAAEDVMTSYDARLAVNVNRLEDARIAEAML